MVIEIDSSEKPVEALEHLWKGISSKKKKELLISMGYSPSWAKTKTIKEMVNRGGGLIASGLLNLVRKHAEYNPHTKIRFEKY